MCLYLCLYVFLCVCLCIYVCMLACVCLYVFVSVLVSFYLCVCDDLDHVCACGLPLWLPPLTSSRLKKLEADRGRAIKRGEPMLNIYPTPAPEQLLPYSRYVLVFFQGFENFDKF